MRYFPLLFLFLFACNKPDPNPELKDPIYADMQSELGIASKGLVDAEGNLTERKQKLAKVTPQKGENKYAEHKVWEAEGIRDSFAQQKKYWTIRVDQRRDFVRKKSLEAFYKNQPWEHDKEVEEYEAEKRLRHAKLNWDAKGRRETFLKESGLAGGGKPGEGGKKEGAPAAKEE